jgi:hypothetical protein
MMANLQASETGGPRFGNPRYQCNADSPLISTRRNVEEDTALSFKPINCFSRQNMACNGLHPRVGIFAIVSDEQGRILIGRRLSTLGKGEHSLTNSYSW